MMFMYMLIHVFERHRLLSRAPIHKFETQNKVQENYIFN